MKANPAALGLGFGLVMGLALCAPGAAAKGGSLQPKPNKDFRELIVQGERPEIAACLVAVLDAARRNPRYGVLRWDNDASDRAVLHEHEVGGQFTRHIELMVQIRVQESLLSAGVWHAVHVACDQPEDGAVRVSWQPVGAS